MSVGQLDLKVLRHNFDPYLKNGAQGRPHSTMDSFLAWLPAAPGSIPGVPNNFTEFLMLPRQVIDSAAA